MSVRPVLDQLTSVVEAIAGLPLRRASYRRRLELEPASGTHRRFTIGIPAGRIGRRVFGARMTPIGLDVVLRVLYARPGGSSGGGDRLSTNQLALADATFLADALGDPRNWNRAVTSLRDVRYQGASRVIDAPLVEVWETRFSAEVEYAWPT